MAADRSDAGERHALLIVENASVPHDRRVWNQARSARRNGYHVTVISPQDPRRRAPSRETVDGVDIIRFPMPFGGNRRLDFVVEYGWALACCTWLSWRLWRSRPFDLMHVANPPDLFFGLGWLFGRRGAAFVFDQHDLGPETYQSKFEAVDRTLVGRLLRKCEALSYRVADAVIVTNESYRERAEGRGNRARSDVFTVRNSPDLALFSPGPVRPEIKAGFDHLAVFVGTMGHQDGVHLLLDAAHHVREVRGRRDIGFALIGTGDMFDELVEQHGRLGLGAGVWFTGFIPDAEMLDYLSTATIGLAPDDLSPLNDISTMIKTMDYMAMGLPVVSFDLTESRFSAQGAAVYAPEHRPDGFGDAIIELVDDPVRRRDMGAIGRARIEGPLSWAESERQLMACYDRAIDNRRRPPEAGG